MTNNLLVASAYATRIQTVFPGGDVVDSKKRVYGYMFKVVSHEAENSWVAYCPGVGGVYEEGNTEEEATANAYSTACAILEARKHNGDLMTEDSEFLRVFWQPLNAAKIASLKPSEQQYLAAAVC